MERIEIRKLILRVIQTMENTLTRRVSGVELLEKEEKEAIIDRALDKVFEGRPDAGLSEDAKQVLRELVAAIEPLNIRGMKVEQLDTKLKAAMAKARTLIQ